MRVRWFGHACFLIETVGVQVLVDPFDVGRAARLRGLRFAYPPVPPLKPDAVLVTHTHFDHDGVAAEEGGPPVVRRPGRYRFGELRVNGVAVDHDGDGGRGLGEVVAMAWCQGPYRFCHLGDCGQRVLRPEQRAAIGRPDLLFVPAGGPPAVSPEGAADLVRALAPRAVVPMHYRTPAVNFLLPVSRFVAAVRGWTEVRQVPSSELDLGPDDFAPGSSGPSPPIVYVLTPPAPAVAAASPPSDA